MRRLPGNSSSASRNASWRPLPVAWLECPGVQRMIFVKPAKTMRVAGFRRACAPQTLPRWRTMRAFTLLELMLVISIIGLMTALALPHLGGITKGNVMTAATRQLLDDVNLARQRAIVNRSTVCMVFLPADFWTNEYTTGLLSTNAANLEITNLAAHQYSAYALISTRTVGDQPGVSNAHYISDWHYLPQGVYIAPFQFTNQNGSLLVSTTNTTIPPAGLSNGWTVMNFATNILFPFPDVYSGVSNYLPYIGFSPSGQLTTPGADQFIMLTSGGIFYQRDSNQLATITFPSSGGPVPPNLSETPPGAATNNPNLIHIDWVTGRGRIERNQF
jgi:prepilin-type N-terminal cleavage/methylation domain-containing protein